MIVGIAGNHSVSVAVREENSFNRHVSTQHDLGHVVNELEWVGVHGRDAELHETTSNHNHQEVCQSNVERRREIREEPSLQSDATRIASVSSLLLRLIIGTQYTIDCHDGRHVHGWFTEFPTSQQ